jgi:hypothetical protein
MSHLEIRDPFAAWFRSLPMLAQWLAGPPIVALCAWAIMAPQQDEMVRQGFFGTLLVFVITVVLSELLRPKPQIEDQRPAGLGDFQVPTTTEGRKVPLIWGRVRHKGPNVVWYGDLLQEAITERVKTGLWSREKITKGFRYHLGLQMALCRGPGVVLKKVFIGDEEVFSGTVSTDTFFNIDKPDLFGGEELGQGGVQSTVDFFTGSTTQPVSIYLNAANRQRITSATTPTAPRYSGTCHLVARQFTNATATVADRGASIGTSTTVKAWSFELERYPGIFTGQSAGEHKVGSADSNPINVIYEILTNDEWGFGFEDTDIDLTNFVAAADTMITESNGFSMLLDREMPAKELMKELERQIDGVVFLSHLTGKWTIKLARADYDIDLVPQLNDSNVAEVRDYTRGSWEDTTNTIFVRYDKRDDDYKLSHAMAQDMANAMIQGDGSIQGATSLTGDLSFPGVKNSALASNLAWRELRAQSYPLARCQLVVNRQMWDVLIGDVVAWTNTKLGFTKLPMRITRIDYGRLQDNKMILSVAQDVFQFAAASMGTPPATGWTPPTTTLVAYPSAQQFAMECPRAILVRDPEYAGDDTATKILCSARNQAGEVTFKINERHSSGTPSGSYAEAGEVYQFCRIGQLKSALSASQANPVSSILLTATPDTQALLEAAFDDAASDTDLGQQLSHLIAVGNEFMLVRDAAISGSDVDLQGVFRGVLDTAQFNHAANTDVFLLHVGSGITDTNFVNTHNVDVELRARSASATFAGAVTKFALTMNKRGIRPYAPAAMQFNNTATDYGTPDLEGDGGAGENTFGFDLDWLRRRYDTNDEVAAMQSDDSTVDASTEYQVRVFVDPGGANTEITSSPYAWQTSASIAVIPRNEILEIAAAGTEIRVQIQARHDIGSETNLTSRYAIIHDVVPTTVNTGLYYLGGNLGPSTATNTYTTAASGVFTVKIGAAYSTSVVQQSINGGGWSTLIAAGLTSGTTASLTAGDTIALRHTVSEGPDPQFILIENPSSVRVAYGCLSA